MSSNDEWRVLALKFDADRMRVRSVLKYIDRHVELDAEVKAMVIDALEHPMTMPQARATASRPRPQHQFDVHHQPNHEGSHVHASSTRITPPQSGSGNGTVGNAPSPTGKGAGAPPG